MKGTIHSITYLRAIGIMLIVLGHLEVNWMPGAYLCVDMFFVIAGFLATKIVVSQFERGQVSLTEYYGKRLLRLLPSFLLVASLTSVASLLLLSPKFVLHYFQSLIFAVLQMANVFFFLNVDYFGPNAIEMPLLHTWALSLEEQFFLTFPVFFILLYRRLSLNKLIVFFCLLMIASLFFNHWLVTNKKVVEDLLFGNDFLLAGQVRPTVETMLFYQVVFRSFEFLAGIIAFLILLKIPGLIADKYKAFVSALGYALVLFSWLFIDEGQFFTPGFFHLIPCLGTVCILAGGDNGFYNKMWPKRILTTLGNASYSIYLTHWPITSFSHFLGADFHNPFHVAIIFSVSLLSGVWLSIKFEGPVRYAGYKDMSGYGKKISLRCLYVVLGLLSLSVLVVVSDGHLLVKEDKAYSDGLKKNYSSYEVVSNPVLRVAILGDSHASHVVPLMRAFFNDKRIMVEGYTGSSCVPIIGLGMYIKPVGYLKPNKYQEVNSICSGYHDHISSNVLESYDAVILSAGWNRLLSKDSIYEIRKRNDANNKLTKDELIEEVDKTIQLFLAHGKKVLILGQVPETRIDTFDCRNRPISMLFDCASKISGREQAQYSAMATDVFSVVAARYNDVIFISPDNVFCPDLYSPCLSEIDGTPLYRDDNHLSVKGSAVISPSFRRELERFANLILGDSDR